MAADGRSFRCALCGAVTKVPLDANEVFHSGAVTLRSDALEETILNVKSNIELERFDIAKKQLEEAADRYAYSPEVWYYLAYVETEGFSAESTEGARHLEYALSRAGETKDGELRKLLEKAKAKMKKLPEIRHLEEKRREMSEMSEQLDREISSVSGSMDSLMREMEVLRGRKDTAGNGVRKAKLLINRLFRLVRAFAAAALFILLPWTRGLWNRSVSAEWRLNLFPDVADALKEKVEALIPARLAGTAALVIGVGCTLMLLSALRSLKAKRLRKAIRERRERRRENRKRICQMEKQAQKLGRELEKKKESRELMALAMINLENEKNTALRVL